MIYDTWTYKNFFLNMYMTGNANKFLKKFFVKAENVFVKC